MKTLWSVLVLLIIMGLFSLVALMGLVNNDPGFGSLAGGVAVAVAILLHALTNLVVCERNPARSASKQGSEKENA